MALELSLENGGGEMGPETDLEESTELRKEEAANFPRNVPTRRCFQMASQIVKEKLKVNRLIIYDNPCPKSPGWST